jgi:DNA-3-methyladenine glycosylase I
MMPVNMAATIQNSGGRRQGRRTYERANVILGGATVAEKKRCPWPKDDDPLYLSYHDDEWGVPVHEERRLFEFLILEGAQAGLSWITVLRKRQSYRRAFDRFDPRKVAAYDRRRVAALSRDPGIIRNRAKIESAVTNARAFLAVRDEHGSFDTFIWSFVGGRPLRNRWKTMAQVPVQTKEAVTMSKELKRRGFRFVGPTMCYSFMQAVGMVNDHLVGCFRYGEVGSED